jgi:predicted MFS family arabinose efflux permease
LRKIRDHRAAVSGPGEPVGGAAQAPAVRAFRTRLPILFLVRTTVNTSFRVIYPFLPGIARGLGISLAAASRLITLRMVAGMGAPLLGPLADRYGRRRVMEVALLLFVLASLLLAGVGTLAAAAAAFTLYGVAKALYDPAVHAYVGDQVPYRERGRAVGVVELSWSSAWLLGVPASGFLIERFGWRAPWAVLAVLGLLGAWLTHAGLPPARRPLARGPRRLFTASMVATWRDLLRRRSVAVLLLTSFLLTLAIEVPFIVYGAWLETAFGLSLSTLGLAPALAGVMLMLLTFEFGLVSLLPLATELAPEARAALFSLNITALSLSRVLAAIVGGWLWQWQSIALHAGGGAACALAAALLLARGMAEVA